MADLVFVVMTIAFFTVALVYAGACGRGLGAQEA